MKISELLSHSGTYAAVRVLDPANTQLTDYIKATSVPSVALSKERRKHVTLLYSRTHLPNYCADPVPVHRAKAIGFDMFDLRPGEPDSTKCLVLLLSAPTLVARHRELMSEHGATYDFPIYNPHITLAYGLQPDFDVGSLPLFREEILLGEEYSEDLDLK